MQAVEQAFDVRVPWVHAYRRSEPTRRVPVEASHLTEEASRDVVTCEGGVLSTTAPSGGRATSVADARAARALPVLRGAHQQPRAGSGSFPRRDDVASIPATAKSEGRLDR